MTPAYALMPSAITSSSYPQHKAVVLTHARHRHVITPKPSVFVINCQLAFITRYKEDDVDRHFRFLAVGRMGSTSLAGGSICAFLRRAEFH